MFNIEPKKKYISNGLYNKSFPLIPINLGKGYKTIKLWESIFLQWEVVSLSIKEGTCTYKLTPNPECDMLRDCINILTLGSRSVHASIQVTTQFGSVTQTYYTCNKDLLVVVWDECYRPMEGFFFLIVFHFFFCFIFSRILALKELLAEIQDGCKSFEMRNS